MRKKIGLMILIFCTSVLIASTAYGADLVISTAAELRSFATAVNNGNDYSGKTVELANDIDLENSSFTPIGKFGALFRGTFDGNGNKITGLYISSGSYSALFGVVEEPAIIKNVTVSGSINVSNGNGIGGIAGGVRGGATIKNCISNVNVTGAEGVGGIFGYTMGNAGIIIENCVNNGNITGTSTKVGGITGYIYSEAKIINCINNGKITSSYSDTDEYISLGGIAGGSTGKITITGCENNGEVEATKVARGVGGIIGYVEDSDTVDISNSCNKGNVTNTANMAWYTGGIIGYHSNESSKISKCYNAGTITANSYLGGIAAFFEGTIENAYNIGTVNGNISLAGDSSLYIPGGIVGYHRGYIKYVYNVGTVNVLSSDYSEYTGAICGYSGMGSAYMTAAYYLNGTANAGIKNKNTCVTTSKTSDEMKTAEMVALLNASQSETVWVQDKWNINNGYPIFVWQAPPDSDPPTVTFSVNGTTTYVAKASTVVTVEDGSGLGTLMYQWTESDVAPNESTFTNTFESGYMITLSGRNGMWYLWVYAEDTLGNSTIAGTDSFLLDGIAPEGEMEITSVVYEEDGMKFTNSNNLRINITNVSDNITSEANMKIALINENNFSLTTPNSEIEWMDYTSTINWQASNGDGLKRVYVIFKDEAGNQSLYLAQ